MFYFERKIFYIEGYHMEERRGNIGYIMMTLREDECRVEIGLRNVENPKIRSCRWYAVKEQEKVLLETFPVREGQADFYAIYPKNRIGKARTPREGWQSYIFEFDDGSWGKCNISGQAGANSGKEATGVIRSYMPKEIRQEKDSVASALRDETEEEFQEFMKQFPVLQPFPSQGNYVQITPFAVKYLAPDYQSMAQNSFLLHGYYTYHHLILGYYRDDKKHGYYLGVPGTFQEREQMLADMFGFEGYEHSGNLGYYMKRVELGKIRLSPEALSKESVFGQ